VPEVRAGAAAERRAQSAERKPRRAERRAHGEKAHAVRALSWRKAWRLLEEIQELVGAAEIAWAQKAARPNSPEVWARAMEQMCVHPPSRLPLRNHNYLRTIAYDLADEIDKTREAQSAKRIAEGIRTPNAERSMHNVPTDAQWEENRRRIAELARGVVK
jgi:hypothetical protein